MKQVLHMDTSWWGGLCEHRWCACRSAGVLYQKDFDGDKAGHLKLLEYVGICPSSLLFAPFWREYFRAGQA